VSETLPELKKILDYGADAIKKDASKSGKLFKEFSDLYYKIFNEACQPCSDCPGGFESSYKRAFEYYSNKLKNPNFMETSKSQFKIKGGGTINSKHGDFNQATMTDEDVFRLLKAEPNYINSFEKESIPANWQQLVAEFHDEEYEEEEETADPNDLTLKSKSELAAIATEKGYDAKEWSKMNKTNLLAYIQGKATA
jgi:hypothetical protein